MNERPIPSRIETIEDPSIKEIYDAAVGQGSIPKEEDATPEQLKEIKEIIRGSLERIDSFIKAAEIDKANGFIAWVIARNEKIFRH